MEYILKNRIEVEQITLESGFRYYETAAGKVPSVSTVLNTMPSKGLEAWKKRLLAKKIDPERRLRYTAIRGTVIHSKIANHFKANLNEKQDSLEFSNPADMEFYTALKNDKKFNEEVNRGMDIFMEKFLSDHEVQPYKNGVEFPVVSKDYRFAGTVDLLAVVDGYITIIDFKTSKRVIKKHELQCAAYAQAFSESYGFQVENTAVVSFPPDIEFLGEIVNPYKDYKFVNVPENSFDEFIPYRDAFYDINGF
ncbi:MAG: PD-(D/E)XK nuclease family protein [Candidatus Hodarchaeales archaeon]